MIVAIIQKHGENDFEIDQLELSGKAEAELFKTAEENCGCSERGTKDDIARAVMAL